MFAERLLNALDGDDDGSIAIAADIQQALGSAAKRALERAAALYVWKRAWESELPASRRGGDRKSASYKKLDQSDKMSFCSVAATAIGLDERSVQRDVALAEALGSVSIKRLWQSPIADNAAALKVVAGLDESRRSSLFSIWTDNPALTFSAAMTAARLRAADDSDEAAFRGLVSGWTRASSKARRRFLDEIGLDQVTANDLVARWRKRGGK